jgi:hypothetical protein
MLRLLSFSFFGFLLGCSASTTRAEPCDRFCEGVLGCLEGDGRCVATDEAALLAFCDSECMDLAAALSEADRERTVGCLDCLDRELDPGTCTITFLGESLEGPCETACTGVPYGFATSFGEALNARTPALYTCSP